MIDLIELMTPEDAANLSEEQQLIIDCIGLDNYKKLLKQYPGAVFYIAKAENATMTIRNRLIFEDFDGGNYKQLALKYGIGERTVRTVINEERRKRNGNSL